jgi:hypothetical protein
VSFKVFVVKNYIKMTESNNNGLENLEENRKNKSKVSKVIMLNKTIGICGWGRGVLN